MSIQQPVKVCPRCGREAPLTAMVCLNCGHEFRTKFAPDPPKTQMYMSSTPQPPPTQMYGMHQQRPQIQNARQYPAGTYNTSTPIILALLIAGGGQFANGQSNKGSMILIIAIVGSFFTFGIAGIVMWGIGVADAALIAERLRRGEVVTPNQWF
jgi:hypothetical protein